MIRIGHLAFSPAHVDVVRPIYDAMGWRGIEIVVTETGHDSTKRNIGETKQYLEENNIPYSIGFRKKYDIVSSCTLVDPSQMKKISHRGTKLVRVMYSVAGKNYTYNRANSVFDIILAVGEHSANMLRKCAPCIAIGSPKHDKLLRREYDREEIRARMSLNSDKPVVLYLPTWGDQCSIERYAAAIVALSNKYVIIFKPHPITLLNERSRVQLLKHRDVIYVNSGGSSDELMAIADVVVSDYSGSIFEAFAADKPVLLLDVEPSRLLASPLHDPEAPEHKVRNEALCAKHPDELEGLLAETLLDHEPWPAKRRACAEYYFSSLDGTATDKAVAAIHDFKRRAAVSIILGRFRGHFDRYFDAIFRVYNAVRPNIGIGRWLRRVATK